MLKFVFSNFIWDGNSLDFNLLSPLDLLFECKQSKVWLPIVDAITTSQFDEINVIQQHSILGLSRQLASV